MASEIVAEPQREPPARASLPRLSPAAVTLITASIFFWITGNGVLDGGLNPDDWRQLGRTPPEWGSAHGRWAMDLVYRFLFQERFIEPLQLLLVYGCFLYIAMTLARAAVGPPYLGLAAVAIFLAGVNHPYMTDVLNFSAHIFGYPFALALSLAAFALAAWAARPRRLAISALAMLLAGQLLAVALGLYPSFALFGLILPAIALIRTDRVTHSQAIRLVASAAIVSLIGLAIYLLEWRAYEIFGNFYSDAELRAMDHYEFVRPSLSVLLDKVTEYPTFLKTVYGGALWNLRPAHAFYELFALLSAAAWGLAASLDLFHQPSASEKALSLLRRSLGFVGAVVVIPTLFWFTYVEIYAPPRTFAQVGFIVPVMLLACAASAQVFLPRKWGERAMEWIGIAPALTLSVVAIFISAAMWSDQERVAERDIATATSIYARLASLEGFDGRGFTLAGSRHDPELRQGVSLGWSAMEFSAARNAIFKGLFGYPGRVDLVSRSPTPCRAFPAAESTFMYEGGAFVCLNDDPGFFPLSVCEPVRGHSKAAVCVRSDRQAVVKITGDCSRSSVRRFSFQTADGRTESFERPVRSPDYRDFARDACYYEVVSTGSSIKSVSEAATDGHILWTHALPTGGGASEITERPPTAAPR